MLRWRDTLILLAGAVFFIGCAGKQEYYFVGQIVALTGRERERGTAAMQGAQLAVEELNSDSTRWVNGRKVAVIHADSESELPKVGDQAVRLVAVNRVPALLGGTTRAEMDAIAAVAHSYAVANDLNVIVVGAAGTTGSPPVAEAFSLGVSPSRRAKIIDQFLNETLKPARLALIVNAADAGQTAFLDSFTHLLSDRQATWETKTYSKSAEIPTIASFPSVTAPTVVFFGPARDAVEFRQAADPPLPMIFAGDEANAQLLISATKDDNGPFWVGAYAREKITAEFVTKFTERFKAPPSVESMMAYDSARVLFEAARDVKSFAASKLAIRFSQAKPFESLNGPIEFGKADRIGRGPAFVLQAKRGQAVIQKTFDAEKQ